MALHLLCLLAPAAAEEEEPPVSAEHYPYLDNDAVNYRTPRAGDAFRTEVFGRQVVVPPRDRLKISAMDVGVTGSIPGVPSGEVLPFASIYLWRHPDENTILRATLVGVFNDVFYAQSSDRWKPLEAVFNFENYTVPFYQAELVDGKRIEEESLLWGSIRGGAGIGYRRQLENPGKNDNMMAVSLLLEPGYLFFDAGGEAASDFREPVDTFEGRSRLKLRLDRFDRNLLELPHEGHAWGADAVYGWRARWEDWGRDRREDASSGRDYGAVSAYAAWAGGVPFMESDTHRLFGSIHGGIGDSLDRYSGFRLGGGPKGEEYEANSRALLPGAVIQEFITDEYLSAIGEYRWEPIFFTYLSARTSVAFLERRRLRGEDVIVRRDDVLASVGGRITTGFIFRSRLQIDYNYSFGVIRKDEYGGHEITAHFSRDF